MKGKITKALIGIGLLAALASGCTKKEPEDGNRTEPATTVAQSVDESKKDKARAAYMDFLNGNASVRTAEHFREDDAEYNYDYLTYGEYNYFQLKEAISEYEPFDMLAKYSLVDFGNDGVEELVLRFESQDEGRINWVGIIHYNGEKLELNSYFEDGYRVYSDFYTNGYLEIGGAYGAGAHGYTISQIDANGFKKDLFTAGEFYSVFATNIVYDLVKTGDETGFDNDYDQFPAESSLVVKEYKAEDGVKLMVRDWSEDADVRKREEAYIQKLVSLGAEIISEEEMTELCTTEKYEGAPVEWMDWDDGSKRKVNLTADYATKELLEDKKNSIYFNADTTGSGTNVVIYTDIPVKDFSVCAILAQEIEGVGAVGFSREELFSLPELTPQEPLVIGMQFDGTIPNMGISYFDEASGERKLLSINMSGYDGSIFLAEEIEICE